MKRMPLDENEHVSVLLDSTDERHEGYPLVLMPYHENADELRLTENQSRCLYEILQEKYKKRIGEQNNMTDVLRADDLQAHLEDESLRSLQLAPSVSVQFNEQTGSLLIATNSEQHLIDAEHVQQLLDLLYSERDALYVARHKEFYAKYV